MNDDMLKITGHLSVNFARRQLTQEGDAHAEIENTRSSSLKRMSMQGALRSPVSVLCQAGHYIANCIIATVASSVALDDRRRYSSPP
mmetsp:Transcript_38088/g.45953  ORF Transcript_38088/g.45953 Transcript_38088/m.45953 type:complete len:87 (-) Transcript_38088:27-287(-)